MHRVVSFFILVSFFVVANTSVVMAFSMQSGHHGMHSETMSSHREMMETEEGDDCCPKMQSSPMDCDTSNHACCFAPFPATSTVVYSHFHDPKSYSFTLLQDTGSIFFPPISVGISSHTGHSPPGFSDHFVLTTTYTELIGKVRSNI